MEDPIRYKLFEWKKLSESDNDVQSFNSQQEEFIKSFKEYSSLVKSNKQVIGSLENRQIRAEDKDIFNAGNNVGIIEFGRFGIELRPKLDTTNQEYFWRFLPHMLHSLDYSEDFDKKIFLDPKQVIKLPAGCSIVTLLALSFVSTCNKVIRKGLLKKYLLEEERTCAVKGRIDFSSLSKKKAWDYSKVPCKYYDLTFDNPENQIILWCANRLIAETRKINQVSYCSEKKEIYIVKKLREQYHLLSTEISLVPKTKNDAMRINLSGVSPYYTNLINLCKSILEEKLFSFDDSKKESISHGINFIIDMDWVFEQYMTSIFNKCIQESFKDTLEMQSQKIRYLGDENELKIKPDLIIRDKKTRICRSIIDFKWKSNKKNSNADFYQVICYSLAELQKESSLNKIEANLLAVSTEETVFKTKFDTISEAFGKENKNKKILIFKLALNSKELDSDKFQDIENNIKKQVNEYLGELLSK